MITVVIIHTHAEFFPWDMFSLPTKNIPGSDTLIKDKM